MEATNSNLNNIEVYVGNDGKLHFVDSGGADSVLPFNKADSWTLKITFKVNQNNWSDTYGKYVAEATAVGTFTIVNTKGALKISSSGGSTSPCGDEDQYANITNVAVSSFVIS